jgi:hypothetical protein
VVPVKEVVIVTVKVVTDLRETRTALGNRMPGEGEGRGQNSIKS